MALVRDAAYRFNERGSNALPLADSTIVYQHAALGLSGGRVRPLQSGDRFAGFAGRRVDNRALAAGAPAVNVPIIASGSVDLLVPGVAATDVGSTVYASDDNTFGLSGARAIGSISSVVGTDVARVEFDALGAVSSVSGDGGAAERVRQLLDANRAVIGVVGNSIMAWASRRALPAALIGGLGGAASASKNVAVAGDNPEEMLAQVPQLDSSANAVLMMEGTNAAADGFTTARHINGMRAVGATIQARGMSPILLACPPRELTVSQVLANYTAEFVLAENEGWLWVDPWRRYVDTDGTWVAGASSDGDHPLDPVHMVAGADAAAEILGRTTGRFLCRANSGHGLLTNALGLTDTNSDGLPDGWGGFSVAGSVSRVAATYPASGQAVRLNLAQTADGEIYRSVPLTSVADGSEILVSGVVEVTAITNARVVVWAVFSDGGEVGGAAGRTVASVSGAAHAARYVQLRVRKPAGLTLSATLQIWVTVQSFGGAYTADARVSSIQAFDLTAATF